MIYGRPDLVKDMGSIKFREYYYTDEEMVEFLKSNGLDSKGDRAQLIEKIVAFMKGDAYHESRFIQKPEAEPDLITYETIIEEDFEYSDKHKVFFEKYIGSGFYLNDDFHDWLLSHAGKTYGDAVDVWDLFLEINP